VASGRCALYESPPQPLPQGSLVRRHSHALFRAIRGSLPLLAGTSCCALAFSAHAETYYVSADAGGDAVSGRTAAEAFHSFGKAVSVLKPGDRLIVEDGLYPEGLQISVSGTAQAPIQIQGAAGPRPKLRSPSDAVEVDGDYIEIAHLDVVGASGSGIVVQPGHHHVLIEDNVAHDSGTAGINGIQTDYISIVRNQVYRNSMTSPWQGSGISLYQAANIDDAPGFHNVIAQNIVYENANKTPDPKLPAKSQGHTTDGNGIIVDDFRHTQAWMGKRTPAFRSRSLVENNLVFRNGGRGIHIFLSDDVVVRNNTVAFDLQDSKILGTKFGEIETIYAKNVEIYNNMMVPKSRDVVGYLATDASSIKADYNLTVGSAATYLQDVSDVTWQSHNIAGQQAGFRNSDGVGGQADFHLTDRSDAVGNGDAATSSAVDLDARARPKGRPVDIGAYQLGR
jgi:parallel beta-helix repeat protein